jgi:hypothetical protein
MNKLEALKILYPESITKEYVEEIFKELKNENE